MWEMKTASIFSAESFILLIRIWQPSPQSIKNERPRTESTWALGYLFITGRAEAVPNILSLKSIQKSVPKNGLFSAFKPALESCKF